MKVYLFVLLGVFVSTCGAQKVDACPVYACNPRGTFSYLLNGPNSTNNAYIAWISDHFIGPLPQPLGCVGNSNNIVCQSNGPDRDVGYISFDVMTGKIEWIDHVLRFPGLPVMDVYGDIIGTDGHYLVEYDDSGKMETPIPFSSFIYPVYSSLVTANGIIIIVSKNGIVIGYGTDGVVLGSIELKGTVERSNGTFIPVAQPILNENRVYILTEFKPDNDGLKHAKQSVLGMQRLYAIDIFERMVDRLHITWYFNFQRESGKIVHQHHTIKSGSDVNVVEMGQDSLLVAKDIDLYPSIMFNVETKIVMVNLPPPYNDPSNGVRTLWGLQDGETVSSLAFRVTMSLRSLSMFDTSFPFSGSGSANGSYVWGLTDTRDNILRINPANGVVDSTLKVADLVKMNNADVTSALMVSRRTMQSEDILIFGIKVSESKSAGFVELCNQHRISGNNTAYVVAVQGSPTFNILWMIPTPDDMEVKGQIAGIPLTGPNDQSNSSDNLNDILVVLVGNDEASKVFVISSK